MGKRVSITQAASDARVEIIQRADEGIDVEPVGGDVYVPPIRKPPIVIALQPLEEMLGQGSLSAFVGRVSHLGVIVEPAETISGDLLDRAADVADADILVGLRDDFSD